MKKIVKFFSIAAALFGIIVILMSLLNLVGNKYLIACGYFAIAFAAIMTIILKPSKPSVEN